MTADPIVIEQALDASVSIVWYAITDKDQMCQWFFESMSDFQPEVGFETQFDVECEGRVFSHQWKVIEVIQEKKIVYEWRYGGFPGSSIVSWEITKTSDQTLLRLTHRGGESFPQNVPEFTRESCEAGWKWFIQ